MKSVGLININSTNCYHNLALEEYVLVNKREGDYLLLWQNDNTIVIGKNQNTEEEINRTFVTEHGIHVVRRTTGGGAVYHDMGNLNFSFITDLKDATKLTMERFTIPIVNALKTFGVNAQTTGRNDITVDGRKISGNAQRVYKGRILHHGTLLFDANMAMVSGALNVKPEKFRSKSAKSVRSRVGNIIEFIESPITMEEFKSGLIKSLTEGGTANPVTLNDKEQAEILKLQKDKYETWDWNFGYSPKCNIKNQARYNGGSLEVQMEVEDGRLNHIRFYGDFMAVLPLDELSEALAGLKYDPDEIEKVLQKFVISDYFGSILLEEVMDCIFHVNDTQA